jgi:hypothetical protein
LEPILIIKDRENQSLSFLDICTRSTCSQFHGRFASLKFQKWNQPRSIICCARKKKKWIIETGQKDKPWTWCWFRGSWKASWNRWHSLGHNWSSCYQSPSLLSVQKNKVISRLFEL